MKKEFQKGPSLTEFMPADARDYLFSSERYIAFETALVSFLCKQNVIHPNHLTYSRFVVCLILLCLSSYLSYLHIFTLAAFGALSDFFDGALARAAARKTRLGMIIDPLADKLLALSLIYILLTRKVLDPIYLFFMLIMESHLLLIPLLSWFHGMRSLKKNRVGSVFSEGHEGGFTVKSKEIFVGKIKAFIYALALLSMLMGQAVDSRFLSKLALGLLISGIATGGVALCIYIVRWFKRPFTLSDFHLN